METDRLITHEQQSLVNTYNPTIHAQIQAARNGQNSYEGLISPREYNPNHLVNSSANTSR